MQTFEPTAHARMATRTLLDYGMKDKNTTNRSTSLDL